MRLGTGQSGATLEILHIMRQVPPYLRRASGLEHDARLRADNHRIVKVLESG
jgi:hypothetical protein